MKPNMLFKKLLLVQVQCDVIDERAQNAMTEKALFSVRIDIHLSPLEIDLLSVIGFSLSFVHSFDSRTKEKQGDMKYENLLPCLTFAF